MKAPFRLRGRINEDVPVNGGMFGTGGMARVSQHEAGHTELVLWSQTARFFFRQIQPDEARRIGELLIACADEAGATDPRVSATDSCDSPPLGAGLDPNAAIHDPADSIDVEPS